MDIYEVRRSHMYIWDPKEKGKPKNSVVPAINWVLTNVIDPFESIFSFGKKSQLI